MNWETLICYGDSITIGARSYLGYPEYAADLLAKELRKSWNVINHATSGFTTIDLVRSVDNNFTHLKEQNASISSILIGTNDLKRNTSPEDYRLALNLLVLKVKLLTVGGNVVLIRIIPLGKGIMYPYNFEMNTLAEEYNRIIEEVAAENKIRIFDFSVSDVHLFDGVHLNDAGSKECAKQLAAFILKDKGI